MWWRGREIQFFMNRQDEEVFAGFVLSEGNVWIVRHHWYEAREYEAYNDTEGFFGQPVIDERHMHPGWLIWNKDLCGDDLVFRKVTGQPFYEIRMDMNYVIEFTRCVIKDQVMRDGRLACFAAYENEGGTLRKKEKLAKWYNRLARWIKKHSVHASWDGEKPVWSLYLMPGAVEFYQQGGKLGQIAGKPGAFHPLKKDLTK